MVRLFRSVLTELGAFTAHPLAFIIVGIYALAWATFDRASLDWHGAATLATWFMTLLIQRAEHRDTQAIHAKLDELLRASSGARSEIARVDEKEPEEIEQQRGKK
jgi:low affinity Fe/Cu permease